MSVTAEEIMLARAMGNVGNFKDQYRDDYPDEGERLAAMVEDALIGFASAGAPIGEEAISKIALGLTAGLLDLGVTFEE